MDLQSSDILFRGSLALALGFIIGFQRERKASTLAGIRTFPLFALTGFFCALLEESGLNWVIASGFIATASIIFRGMTAEKNNEQNHGITTEMAGLLVFLLGAASVVLKEVGIVVVAGGMCALILHLKERMHTWVEKMQRMEVQAIMQFVLIAFVVLPLLPDKTYDSYNVLNPHRVWLMVVLITGISLVSFSIQKIVGPNKGTLWTGIMGGMISSTTTTVTLSRFSARNPNLMFIVPATIIASTAAFLRVFAEILVAAPKTFYAVALPLATLFLAMTVISFVSLFRSSKEVNGADKSELQNPSQLKAAVVFGALFAVILYLSAWAKDQYGQSGLYVVSLISGLIDVDAITLSTSELIENGSIHVDSGWRLIMVAFLSNLAFKMGMVAVIARGKVRKNLCLNFTLSILIGVGILVLWK